MLGVVNGSFRPIKPGPSSLGIDIVNSLAVMNPHNMGKSTTVSGGGNTTEKPTYPKASSYAGTTTDTSTTTTSPSPDKPDNGSSPPPPETPSTRLRTVHVRRKTHRTRGVFATRVGHREKPAGGPHTHAVLTLDRGADLQG